MRFLSTGLILYIEIYISPKKLVGFAEKSGVLYTFLVMPQKTVGQNYIWMFPVVEMEDLRNSGVDIPVDSVLFLSIFSHQKGCQQTDAFNCLQGHRRFSDS